MSAGISSRRRDGLSMVTLEDLDGGPVSETSSIFLFAPLPDETLGIFDPLWKKNTEQYEMVQAAVQYSSPNTLILEIQTYCTTDFTCILYFYTLYQMLYITYYW